jgi:hypothetical protein
MIFKNVVICIYATKIKKYTEDFVPRQLFFQNTAIFFECSIFIITFATQNRKFNLTIKT